MGDIQSPPTSSVAQHLQTLAQLYQQGQASALMERTLDKLLAHEADVCRAQLGQLQQDLAEFEQQYNLSSAEFHRRFQAGQTDDRMDYVDPAGRSAYLLCISSPLFDQFYPVSHFLTAQAAEF